MPTVESQPTAVLRRWQGESTTCQPGTYVLRTNDKVNSLLGRKDIFGLQTGEVAIVVCGSKRIKTEAVYQQKVRVLVVVGKTIELASCPSIPSYELGRVLPARGIVVKEGQGPVEAVMSEHKVASCPDRPLLDDCDS